MTCQIKCLFTLRYTYAQLIFCAGDICFGLSCSLYGVCCISLARHICTKAAYVYSGLSYSNWIEGEMFSGIERDS